jgi:5-methylcytosine-specific restriction endonuclease McrA
MPTRLCSEPRCPSPATYRGRCATHARTNNQRTHRNRTIYNSKRWRILRRHILTHQPLCAGYNDAECDGIATDVDHITPIHQGGDAWNPTNLQPLCQSCHGRKTRNEQQTA